MNKNKAIRLLAASWLIAPTILSTQAVFATENQPTTTSSSLVSGSDSVTSTASSTDTTESSTTDSSATTGSTGESSTTDSSTTETGESTEKPAEEVATHTLTVNPELLGKIKLSVISNAPREEKELTIQPNGTVSGLKEGTKVFYEITPPKGEKLLSFQVNGAQEVNYQKKILCCWCNGSIIDCFIQHTNCSI